MQDIIEFWNRLHAKILIMLMLLILCQRQKYHALVLFVSLSKPYLKKFQTDMSMVSFIYIELKSLRRNQPSTL